MPLKNFCPFVLVNKRMIKYFLLLCYICTLSKYGKILIKVCLAMSSHSQMYLDFQLSNKN